VKQKDIGKPNRMFQEWSRRQDLARKYKAGKIALKRRVFLAVTLALFLLALAVV